MTSFPSADRRSRQAKPVKIDWVHAGCIATLAAFVVGSGVEAWLVILTHHRPLG